MVNEQASPLLSERSSIISLHCDLWIKSPETTFQLKMCVWVHNTQESIQVITQESALQFKCPENILFFFTSLPWAAGVEKLKTLTAQPQPEWIYKLMLGSRYKTSVCGL